VHSIKSRLLRDNSSTCLIAVVFFNDKYVVTFSNTQSITHVPHVRKTPDGWPKLL